MTQIFGTLKNEVPAPLVPYWQAKPLWKQVHTTNVVEVVVSQQNCGEADAFLCRVPKIPITVMTADCVPVVLERKDHTCIAVAHAGWRGTYASIVPELWSRLKKQGEVASQWRAWVGPSIGPCCYEVDEELSNQFRNKFRHFPSNLINPEFRRLNLGTLNRLMLEEIGMSEIAHLEHCTCCYKETGEFLYHSYRRSKKAGLPSVGRQYSGLIVE